MKVPYYSNPDGTHCFQACLKMILGTFLPKRDFSREELDIISGKAKDKATWPMKSLLWLQEERFEVRNIELFDYQAFADQGAKYLRTIMTEEMVRWSEENSDLNNEQVSSREFLRKQIQEMRTPSKDDIRALTNSGYLLTCELNAKSLYGELGFEGHAVLIKALEDETITLNDPDVGEDIIIPWSQFEQAWSANSPSYRNLIAVKR